MPRKRKHQSGGFNSNTLSKINDLAKKSQVISEALKMSGLPLAPLAGRVVGALGYGKRKRKRRAQRGGWGWGSIGSVLGNVTRIPAMGIIGATSGLQQGVQSLGSGMRGGSSVVPPSNTVMQF